MTQHFKIATMLMALSFALLGIFPNSPVVGAGFISAIALFGFLEWIDRRRIDSAHAIEAQIKDLKDKVNALTLGRMR
jgi:hypothetical protein